MRRNRDDEFEAYVRRRRGAMLRSATALTGGDGHMAEDLVQVALVRLYVHWSQARRGNVDAYTNRILVNLLIDEKRRPAWLREHPRAVPPEVITAESQPDGWDDPEILDALRSLPTRMRAAVVLRHVEGLSVKETAAALGCRTGTVKSQTARGLAHLRNWPTSLASTQTSSFKGADQCTK
jgi:RNA polymerase sigma-70 factor (sigma-E family)